MENLLLLLHPPAPPPQAFRSNLLFPPAAKQYFPRFTNRRRRRSFAGAASSRNGSDAPDQTGCPVPMDQQPINEYKSLSTSLPFSWASGDIVQYCSRLFVTGASFALFVGLPVAWFGSVGPQYDPLRPLAAAVSSGILVVSLAVLRMYLGWAYVGNRLLSATVEYEETGWYDGQIWVKTPEILTRDRLLGSITVKPVLSRLKNTLVTLAAMLLACVLLFISLEREAMDLSRISEAAGGGRGRAVPGVYNDDSARSFEPDAFCGEPSLSSETL
ncbi:Protein CONSERVED IN THE GREEN LINEAGE AND DIATOMS 27, chloroplastic [Linum grandiflorum]